MPDIKQSKWEEDWKKDFKKKFPITSNIEYSKLMDYISDLLAERDKKILQLELDYSDCEMYRERLIDELAERDKQWLSCLPERENSYDQGHNICLETILDNAKKLKLID